MRLWNFEMIFEVTHTLILFVSWLHYHFDHYFFWFTIRIYHQEVWCILNYSLSFFKCCPGCLFIFINKTRVKSQSLKEWWWLCWLHQPFSVIRGQSSQCTVVGFKRSQRFILIGVSSPKSPQLILCFWTSDNCGFVKVGTPLKRSCYSRMEVKHHNQE